MGRASEEIACIKTVIFLSPQSVFLLKFKLHQAMRLCLYCLYVLWPKIVLLDDLDKLIQYACYSVTSRVLLV